MYNNNNHDYTERRLNARWIMFGAFLITEVEENVSEYIENSRGNGFVVKKVRSLEICIYLTEKLA